MNQSKQAGIFDVIKIRVFGHVLGQLIARELRAAPRVFLALGIAALGSGCVSSFVRPVGEWGRPADLRLTKDSLSGVKVAVRCGELREDRSVRERSSRICDSLGESLEEIGAEIINGEVEREVENEKTVSSDLTLWYLEKKSGVNSCPWAVSWAYWSTLGWVPCADVAWSEAELRMADQRGVVLERAPVRVEKVVVYGLPVVAASLYQNKSRSGERQRELERQFLRYVQNRVYSQSVRLNLATAGAAASGSQ